MPFTGRWWSDADGHYSGSLLVMEPSSVYIPRKSFALRCRPSLWVEIDFGHTMELETRRWESLTPAQQGLFPAQIKNLFNDAVRIDKAVSVYLVSAGFGDIIWHHGHFPDTAVPTDDEANRFLWATRQDANALRPVGLSLDKTLEVTIDQAGGRSFPTTLLYSGELFGLWELADFRGEWTIRSGTRSFLVPHAAGQEKRVAGINRNADHRHLKWGSKSRLQFWALPPTDSYATWKAEVVFFDPNMFWCQSNNNHLHYQLRSALLDLTVSQMKRALDSSRDQRFRSAGAGEESDGSTFAFDLQHVIQSLRTGALYSYYLAAPGIEDMLNDIPADAIFSAYSSYFDTSQDKTVKPKESNKLYFSVFVPCLFNEKTLRRTHGKIYQFLDVCPLFFQKARYDSLEQFVRKKFPPRRMQSETELPNLKAIPLSESVFSKQSFPDGNRIERFTEGRGRDQSGEFIVRFFVDHVESTDAENRIENKCDVSWIPLTYNDINCQHRSIHIDKFAQSIIWVLQIESAML